MPKSSFSKELFDKAKELSKSLKLLHKSKNQNLIEISQKTKRKIQLIFTIIPKESLRLEDSILQSINKG